MISGSRSLAWLGFSSNLARLKSLEDLWGRMQPKINGRNSTTLVINHVVCLLAPIHSFRRCCCRCRSPSALGRRLGRVGAQLPAPANLCQVGEAKFHHHFHLMIREPNRTNDCKLGLDCVDLSKLNLKVTLTVSFSRHHVSIAAARCHLHIGSKFGSIRSGWLHQPLDCIGLDWIKLVGWFGLV